jgi:hypothetical protein
MGDFGDGIGTVIEGGLLGRTVEPRAGETSGHGAAQIECLNCGTSYRGNFCPECGQKAHLHRSLAAIGHDIMHGVLHLDGKLWNTLPMLVFKPGELTRRFVAGERAKFVSPMAMFLFTVFAMFAVFQMVGISTPTDIPSELTGAENDNPFRQQIQKQITELEQQRAQMAAADPDRKAIDNQVKTLNAILAKSAAPDSGKSNVSFHTGSGWLNDHLLEKWKKNPGLMLYKLQSNGYKFSWLLIPLSIPFLWLMFLWRREFKAYDHAVFVTYSLSFMSLLFIAMSLLSTVPNGSGLAGLLFVIGAPLHLYKQLRYAYGLKRFSAIWRFCVLFVAVQIVLTAFLLILGVLGAF